MLQTTILLPLCSDCHFNAITIAAASFSHPLFSICTTMAGPTVNGSFAVATNGHQGGFKYAAFKIRGSNVPRIGSLDVEGGRVIPLTYKSGTHIHNLYEVIEAGSSEIVESKESVPVDQVELLPPIYGRDILAVGKNYAVRAPNSRKPLLLV